MRKITGREFLQQFADLGIIPPETTRVVIDAKVGGTVHIYYDILGDERLLDVKLSPGLSITEGHPRGGEVESSEPAPI